MKTILRVGAEGGSISLYAKKDHNQEFFYFSIRSNERALADLLNEDDQNLLPLLERERKFVSKDLANALEQLGPIWRELYPIEVHPDFGPIIYAEVAKFPPDNLDYWEKKCLGEEGLFKKMSW
ncbi:hypothetical protein [Paenibacillus sp. SN-8-1]|uniref:hypothetical protein n=1 Tax=Paenibacillus sp. SN-8-1 TaxID=3435409 RepID=UPI003D9A8BDC